MTYGTGTRSYNRSTEKRQMDRERAAATKQYEAQPSIESEVRWSMCTCRSFRFAHEPEKHDGLKADYDWRPWEQVTYLRRLISR